MFLRRGNSLSHSGRRTGLLITVLMLAGLLLSVFSVTDGVPTAHAASFDVNTTNDAGPGSLRQAILDVNAAPAGTHTITFSVAGTAPVINPTTPLPAITAANVTIGSKGSAATDTCQMTGGMGKPRITLDLTGVAGANGFTLTGDSITLQGFYIQGAAAAGILVNGKDSVITCNTVTAGTTQGIAVAATGTNPKISQNLVYTNGGLGIDLLNNSAADETPAAFTAVPVVTEAEWDGNKLSVDGTAPAGATVEIFMAEAPADTSGYGEGRFYLFTATAAANGKFSTGKFSLPAGVPDPIKTSQVTATATVTTTGTSEFAKNKTVTVPPFTLVKTGFLTPDKKGIIWTVIATNNSPFDLTGVKLTDTAVPVQPLAAGSLTTKFSSTAVTNTVTPGTFPAPAGEMTFGLAAGNALVITFQTTLAATATPGQEFTNFVTATSPDVNGGQPFNSNLAKVRVDDEDDDSKRADVIVRCKFDLEEANDDDGNEIKFKCKLSNIGKGKAKGIKLKIPISVNLIVAYTVISNPKIWVSSIILVGDDPHLVVTFPDIEGGDEDGDNEAVIVFKPYKSPGKNLKGLKIKLNAFVSFGDSRPIKLGRSNGSYFIFGSSNVTRPEGIVILEFNRPRITINVTESAIVDTDDLFEPEEAVDFWITRPDNVSIDLGRGKSDKNGKIVYIINPTSFVPGVYVFVGRGVRTNIQVICIVTIVVVTSGTPTPTASPTVTATVSPTVTATVSPSVTPSVSPTVTATTPSSPSVAPPTTPAPNSNPIGFRTPKP